jgi:regulator of cell morphogenesis and NO signaling
MPTANHPIRDLVAGQPSAAAILGRFGIDLCSQGDETLEQACAGLQLSADQVIEKLEEAACHDTGTSLDVSRYSLTRLIQHIVRTHHRYVRQQLPGLLAIGQKIVENQGERVPKLKRISTLLKELQTEMLVHIEKEEEVFFPYVAQLDEDERIACLPPTGSFRGLRETVFAMTKEHESAGRLIDELESVLHAVMPPVQSCASCAALLVALRAFKQDLDRHIQLEDKLLFPRAVELESTVRGGANYA